MRKLIISAISLVALAAVIATPFANAATVDANGVITVSKGEAQSAMGWTNAGCGFSLAHAIRRAGGECLPKRPEEHPPPRG